MLDLLVILDRSGSMQDAKADHEGGLKSFVEDNRKLAGDVRFTLIQFDTTNPCEVVYDRVALDDVQTIALVPRGGTPLYDAMGRALDHLTKHQPDEVICMVITDGDENESKEWTKDRVKARVKELETRGWTFLFLGANIDAFAAGAAVGAQAGTTLSFNAQSHNGIAAMYNATLSNTVAYRSLRAGGQSAQAASGSLAYSNLQRVMSMSPDASPLDQLTQQAGTLIVDDNQLVGVADTPEKDKA